MSAAPNPHTSLLDDEVVIPYPLPDGGEKIVRTTWVDAFERRDEYVRRFAWGTPTRELIAAIAALGPIVEVGAGNGYWSSLLRAAGAEVDATDAQTDLFENGHLSPNGYFGVQHDFAPKHWTDVREVDAEQAVREHPDWTLLTVWPSYGSDFAARALSRHAGDFLVYVGEDKGGCTGDGLFHRLLDRVYVPVLSHPIPHWPGLHDYATIYKRKGR